MANKFGIQISWKKFICDSSSIDGISDIYDIEKILNEKGYVDLWSNWIMIIYFLGQKFTHAYIVYRCCDEVFWISESYLNL